MVSDNETSSSGIIKGKHENTVVISPVQCKSNGNFHEKTNKHAWVANFICPKFFKRFGFAIFAK
jgi:hypothetical protein